MDLMRRMSPAEKLQRALELSAAVRRAGEAGIRQAQPNASEAEIFALIARRQLGDELFNRIYGPSERHA
jgi:hypothetical protein